ncbi:uncharacterized protein [Rutidosis leptorrhynchoides]|uniref:uncharacterized protein n=1 Tax=Rutidosis leptorrhynchoides TaxID=125765 RepID=UPI003A990DA7
MAMLLKVDFEKAFDSISWEFLVSMLSNLGFGRRWILWIKGCLNSTFASVLVNGSPTEEFKIGRGLRQGDPLSPLLFIICMEGLHVAMLDAIDHGLYKGLRVGNVASSCLMSHSFFADDALFIGEWSDINIRNLIDILKCFYLVSGLQINVHKSNILGIGVPSSELNRVANAFGCKPASFPFSYLGIPIGANMRLLENWKPIVDKVDKRLRTWKVKLLSFGGRLTLIKSVLGGLGTYFFSIYKVPKGILKHLESLRANFLWGSSNEDRKIHWINWDTILKRKEKGGLGVVSFDSLNKALLYKWRWRYLTCLDWPWVRVVKVIHGDQPDGLNPCVHRLTNGAWANINRTLLKLHSVFPSVESCLRIKIGDGCKTSFWHDKWAIDTSLKEWCWRRNIRSGTETQQLFDMLSAISHVYFSSSSDSWVSNLSADGSFSVNKFRRIIDVDPSESCLTVWCKNIPPKVNFFIWRAGLNRLPDKCNLLKKGVVLQNVLCSSCSLDAEDLQHIFFECVIASQVWTYIATWIEVSIPKWNALDDLWNWIRTAHQKHTDRIIIEVICYATLWTLWPDGADAVADTDATTGAYNVCCVDDVGGTVEAVADSGRAVGAADGADAVANTDATTSAYNACCVDDIGGTVEAVADSGSAVGAGDIVAVDLPSYDFDFPPLLGLLPLSPPLHHIKRNIKSNVSVPHVPYYLTSTCITPEFFFFFSLFLGNTQ